MPIYNICSVQWLPWLGWCVVQLHQLLLLGLVLALSLLPSLLRACWTATMMMMSVLRSVKSMQ